MHDLSTRQLSFRRGMADADAMTVSATLCTGARVAVGTPHGAIDEILRLDGFEADNQLPLLDSHNRGSIASVLGSVREIRRSGARLVGVLHLHDSAAFAKIRAGHLNSVSIGYEVLDREVIARGQTKVVDGVRFTAGDRPLHIVRRFRIRELSLVAIGADAAAKIDSVSTVSRSSEESLMIRSEPELSFRSRSAPSLAAALACRMGEHVPADLLGDVDPHGLDCEGLLRACIRADGRALPEGSIYSLWRSAVEGVALGDTLSAAFEAVLLSSYSEAADTTDGWVSVSDAINYRTQERYRLASAADLHPVPRGGKAADVEVCATKSTVRVAKYARHLVIDEQDIVDAPQAFDLHKPIFAEMGRASRRLRPDLVYSLILSNPDLADGTAWLHNDRGNYGTGALATATLGAGIAALESQTQETSDGDAVPLGLPAAYLVVPPSLRRTAAVLLREQSLGQGSDIQLVSEPRLELGVTDPVSGTFYAGSSTAWMLLAPASAGACLDVAYLSGRQEPRLQVDPIAENGKWGLSASVQLSLGACIVGDKGAYFSTGAA